MQRWLWVLWLVVWEAAAAVYVPPVEGGAPFRRDRLPLDVPAMIGLSADLVTLAGEIDGDEPADLRARAQFVGLALALDPTSRRVGELEERLKEGRGPRSADENDLRQARRSAWQLLDWLEQPEAGKDGQTLGACLSDVLAKADPRHPGASSRGGERGPWQGWVAEVAAYQDPVEPPEPEPDPDANPGDGHSTPGPDVRLALRQTTVRVPLWVIADRARGPELKVLPLAVKAWAGNKDNPEDEDGDGDGGGGGGEEQAAVALSVRGPYPERSDWLKAAGARLAKALEARHGSMPAGLTMRFSLPEDLKFSSRNHDGPLGAMLVAADAIFTGVESDGIVFSGVGEDGEPCLPIGFWETLRRMADDPEQGGHLVLPAQAGPFLPYLLTLDQAEFFMSREVLLASGAEGLVAMASGTPDERLAKGFEAFAEVRTACGTRSLGSFTALDSVQSRLAAIARALPEHASARMLALRGTSKWPQRLDRRLYAREIRSALEPMHRLLAADGEDLTVRDLQDAEQACRERLKNIERFYGSVDDRAELHDRAISTVKTLTGLVPDFRRRGEFFDAARTLAPALREYVATVTLLTEAAGDRDTFPIPFAKDPG
jgi:hypothetical protein